MTVWSTDCKSCKWNWQIDSDARVAFTPKSLDQLIEERLKDLAAGRTHGPDESVSVAIAALERRIGERAAKMEKPL